MSRSVSTAFEAAVFAQETTAVFLPLVQIDHPDLSTSIRVVRNYENVTHSSAVFTACAFELELPEDLDDHVGELSLSIQNVDRTIVEAVRDISSPATVTVKVVLASDPDTVEVGPYTWTLRRASYDALVVTGSVLADDILNETYPGDSITPTNFPGLF